MRFLRPVILAIMLMTRLPLPRKLYQLPFTERDHQNSAFYYPVVGALLAAILIAAHFLLSYFLPTNIQAVVLLCLWVWLTGALHLDGLADCMDAYAASHKSAENALTVMQDPQTGSMGVVSIALVLLLKFSVLSVLVVNPPHLLLALLLSSIGSRFFVLVYMVTTPYVRKNGIAEKMAIYGRWPALVLLTIGLSVIAFLTTAPFTVICIILVLGLTLLWWRAIWLKKIGGYTGDCLGAFIELSESAALLAIAALL